MADSSQVSGSHQHEHAGDHSHEHEPHNWSSADYVSRWAQGQDPKEPHREEAFSVLADTIPYEKSAALRILDMGAGYGALTKFLLERFPRATAICQDGSKEMAKLGSERMNHLSGRFEYVLCDFGKHGWSKLIPGTFGAVVSSIAIHNVGSPNIIRGIYEDAYTLVKPGGCFLNFDRPKPPWEEQMKWLRGAGFKDVKIFWQDENRAVFGGFRR
ncbi:MAG TPA: class I SAM-dependent methyltransferase [Terriglobales bacterium]|nr:class I SAM-dependent methyltransferase [Terriglobales bacterium]